MPLALSLCVIEFSESKQRLIDSLHLIWIIGLCTKIAMKVFLRGVSGIYLFICLAVL